MILSDGFSLSILNLRLHVVNGVAGLAFSSSGTHRASTSSVMVLPGQDRHAVTFSPPVSVFTKICMALTKLS